MSTTPNMGLFESTPLVTIGPTWASNIEDSLLLIDAHDHTAGKGLPIASAALNINADLPFGSYQATGLKAAAFTPQASTLATASRLYVVSGDLYYNNAAGTAIQVTSGTAVNVSGVGGITGLAGTTGAVTYSNITKTFTFTQDAGKTANIIGGTITVSEPGVSSASLINIKSPTSLAGGYDITFPATLPVATKYLQVSAAGQLVATDALDNSTLEVSAGSMRIKDLGVTTAKLAATSITAAKLGNDIAGDGLTGANGVALAVNPDGVGIEISADQVRLKASGVTQVKLANTNYAQSSFSGAGSRVGAGTTTICSTNLTVQNAGRMVHICGVGNSGASLGFVETYGAAPWTAAIRVVVDGIAVASLQIGGAVGDEPVFPPSAFSHTMLLSAGARSIALEAYITGAAGAIEWNNVGVIAVEL